MSDSLKGVKANMTFRPYTHEEFAKHNKAVTTASFDMFLKIREEAHRQLREHIEWVADQYVAAGGIKDDLMLIARVADDTDVSYSYILLINKRHATLVGEARLEWVHDELNVSLKSDYGTKPREDNRDGD